MARRPVKAPAVKEAPSTEGASLPIQPQRLLRAYSFIGGLFGRGRFEWHPGQVITDPEEIAYLQGRGVPMEAVAA